MNTYFHKSRSGRESEQLDLVVDGVRRHVTAAKADKRYKAEAEERIFDLKRKVKAAKLGKFDRQYYVDVIENLFKELN